jgi:hypothetical protein
MGTRFWIIRFFTVFVGAFIIIAGAQLVKGHTTNYAAYQGLIWAAIAAAVFTSARIYQSRRGQHCEICKDTPEMQKEATSLEK